MNETTDSKRFSIIKFTRSTKDDTTLFEFEGLIPGINSGVYDYAFHMKLKVVKYVCGFFRPKKKVMVAYLTLNNHEIKVLRDELNLIINHFTKPRDGSTTT